MYKQKNGNYGTINNKCPYGMMSGKPGSNMCKHCKMSQRHTLTGKDHMTEVTRERAKS